MKGLEGILLVDGHLAEQALNPTPQNKGSGRRSAELQFHFICMPVPLQTLCIPAARVPDEFVKRKNGSQNPVTLTFKVKKKLH